MWLLFLVRKRVYLIFKNAHATLRDSHMSKYRSNERVTCVLLIECGLSLEGEAEVVQEGCPGKGGLKAMFEILQSSSNESTRISLGV